MTHDTPPKLLPCPFCGAEPRVMRFHLGNVEDIVGVAIECLTPNCPASPISTGDAMADPIINFTAWNRRAPTALAASPEGQALLREARAQGMDEALKAVNKARETVIHSANRNFIDGVAFGHDRSESAIRTAAAALRAGKGETP